MLYIVYVSMFLTRSSSILDEIARDWLREQVLDKDVTVKSVGKGKYGRWLVELYLDEEEISLNQQLIDKGFADPYLR